MSFIFLTLIATGFANRDALTGSAWEKEVEVDATQGGHLYFAHLVDLREAARNLVEMPK